MKKILKKPCQSKIENDTSPSPKKKWALFQTTYGQKKFQKKEKKNLYRCPPHQPINYLC